MSTNAPWTSEDHFNPSEELEIIQSTLADGDLGEAVAKIKKSLETTENVKLHIAITGASGAGKSTFVNAIRGLGDEDEHSAKTGEVQTTFEPKEYLHPQFKNVSFWDLPGIGTEEFKPSTYLEQVNFSRYDFFIFIGSVRFTCNDALIAREIQRMGKKFYFVRSKIDNDMHSSKTRRRATHDENKVLQQIRADCVSCLEKGGIKSVPVFLVSSFELDKYDFELLRDTLLDNLDSIKRRAFLFSLPNTSLSILEKKKAELKKGVWLTATVSCATALIPLAGLNIALDVAVLIHAMNTYCRCFGLDDESLKRLAMKSGKPLAAFTMVVQSGVNGGISIQMVVSLLAKTSGAKKMFVQRVFTFVPIVGSLVAGSIGFASTYYMLNNFLDLLMEDAQRVTAIALSEAYM